MRTQKLNKLPFVIAASIQVLFITSTFAADAKPCAPSMPSGSKVCFRNQATFYMQNINSRNNFCENGKVLILNPKKEYAICSTSGSESCDPYFIKSGPYQIQGGDITGFGKKAKPVFQYNASTDSGYAKAASYCYSSKLIVCTYNESDCRQDSSGASKNSLSVTVGGAGGTAGGRGDAAAVPGATPGKDGSQKTDANVIAQATKEEKANLLVPNERKASATESIKSNINGTDTTVTTDKDVKDAMAKLKDGQTFTTNGEQRLTRIGDIPISDSDSRKAVAAIDDKGNVYVSVQKDGKPAFAPMNEVGGDGKQKPLAPLSPNQIDEIRKNDPNKNPLEIAGLQDKQVTRGFDPNKDKTGSELKAEAEQKSADNIKSKTIDKPNYNDAEALAESNDRCRKGATIGLECGSTETLVETSKVTNVVGQAAGSMMTQYQGMKAQAGAIGEGTQSAALQGAADTQRNSGQMQMTLGAVNAAMGVAQLMKASEHKKNAAQLSGTSKDKFTAELQAAKTRINDPGFDGRIVTTDEVKVDKDFSRKQAKDAITNKLEVEDQVNIVMKKEFGQFNQLKSQKEKEAYLERKAELMKKGLSLHASDMANEQNSIRKEANQGGLNSTLTGMQMLIGGAMNVKAADNMRIAAARLKNIENNANAITAPKADPFTNPTNAGSQNQTISGSGTNTAASAEEKQEDTGAGPAAPLNDPFNVGDKDGLANAGPTPGKFSPKDVQPGSAGGGSVGGGSTSPAGSGGDGGGGSAAYSNAEKGAGYYESAGGGYVRGGGGGGKEAGGGGGGVDLAGMLAQFLPKQEDAAHGQNILNFGAPGAAAPAQQGSLLDRNANLFDRIHDAYQDKAKQKRIGM